MASKIIRSGFKSQIKQTFATRDKAVPKSSNEIFAFSMMNKGNKDAQHSYYEDLNQSSLTRRSENQGPLYNFDAAGSSVQPAPIPKSLSLTVDPSTTSLVSRFFDSMEPMDYTTKSKQSAVAALAISRRILRTHSLQLFSRRCYGSSSSKSSSNLFQRHDDRRRVSKSKRIKDAFAGRTLSTGTDRSIGILSTKYLEPLRNQNMSSTLGSISQAVQVSSMIQEELMPIDKSMRERISVKNPGALQTEQKELEPLASWHHPPSPEVLSNRILERLAERRHPSSSVAAERSPAETATALTTRTSTHMAYRKRRLDQQCKEPSENLLNSKASSTSTRSSSSGSPPNSKRPTESPRAEFQSKPLPPIAACDSAGTKESVSCNLTARRVNNSNSQGPIRRFSLRRPPKNNVPEIVPPAPGPAAESLNQIKGSTNSGSSYNGWSSHSTEFNLKRYSGPGNWF